MCIYMYIFMYTLYMHIYLYIYRCRQAKGSSGDGKGALLAAESLLTLLDTLHASPVAKVGLPLSISLSHSHTHIDRRTHVSHTDTHTPSHIHQFTHTHSLLTLLDTVQPSPVAKVELLWVPMLYTYMACYGRSSPPSPSTLTTHITSLS